MDIIKLAISKPVGVAVGVILVVMFGLIGFSAIPVQLTPTVDTPIVTVTTSWPGRSPEEIVDQITKEQEEKLKNVNGLKSMRSTSLQGEASVVLEFYVGTDVQRALSDVDDALRQVPEYPEDADNPTREAADAASENAIAWIIIDLDPAVADQFPDFDIASLYYALDKEVKPMFERVEGVAEVNIYGGRDRELRILADHTRMAQLNIGYDELMNALQSENANISAGTINESKREYPIRIMGQYEEETQILDTIVAYRAHGPIYVRDIAEVELGLEKRRSFVRSLGHPAIAINAIRQTDSNVVKIMNGDGEDKPGLKDRIEQVRAEILPNLDPVVGQHLRIRQAYDETIYIDSAISLVTQNLWIGGGIAAFVLLIFLRSFIATGVIALAIPISVIGTFLVLLGMGRTLNVISLAGLAFAVGMVVDNAIVVLENIYRHRQMGKNAQQAAYDGAREVWGAVLASTLTTVAVFVPVLTIQEEAGQLFRDISLAIVASVSLSLIVSITVIPAACSKFLPDLEEHQGKLRKLCDNAFGLAPLCSTITSTLSSAIGWCMQGTQAWIVRPAIVLTLTLVSLIGAMLLMPPLDYLPAGNRNLVFGGLIIPPGYSLNHMERMADRINNVVGPYLVEYDNAEEREAEIDRIAQLAPIVGMNSDGSMVEFDPLPLDNFFVASFNGGMFGGATSAIPEVVKPAGSLLSRGMNTSPDTFGFAQQSSLFGRGVAGGGNSIDVEISGPHLERVNAAASSLMFALGMSPDYGFPLLRPAPANFNLPQQELQIEVTKAGVEMGIRPQGVGPVVRALFDGAFVGDFRDGADTYDMRVVPKGGRLENKEQLADISVRTPAGPIVPLDTILELKPGLAPQAIARIEELPSVTISVIPPDGKPLEEVMTDINENYLASLYDQGLIDPSMRVRLEGTAAQLDEVRKSLLGMAELGSPTAASLWTGSAIAALGLLAGGAVFLRGLANKTLKNKGISLAGAIGTASVGLLLAALAMLSVWHPELATARMVWALVVTYLLMCALFDSFTYPFVIMITVPLAVVGGFAGLAIVHKMSLANPTLAPQNLDVLTMLGFVILIGVVVNNAILIVHQSLNHMKGIETTSGEKMEHVPAIAMAVRTRMRPVFMSTLTSVGGMLPLVLTPGAGSELYRGLGSVVVGGLLVSTIFTLVLTPLLLSLVIDMTKGLKATFARKPNGDGDTTTSTRTSEVVKNDKAAPQQAALQPV